MSHFEIIMLICFGAAWPFSIYRSWVSRSTKGKSLLFMIIVMVGYIAGVLHKIYFDHDLVIYLYGLNFFMVAVDVVLYFRNRAKEKKNEKIKT
ncbi:MAG: hypothetical protein DRP93_00435 [Candidatus Neomarinimicrobiota bacterium]|nr:MAG: hypothetical protein DRP93_00435 [Candidatus Neomarinimicrobiota bacterium]